MSSLCDARQFPGISENERAVFQIAARRFAMRVGGIGTDSLRTELLWVERNRFGYLVEMANEAVLRAFRPNHHLLRQLPVRAGNRQVSDGPRVSF